MIYLDMDDVCCDTIPYALRWLGYDCPATSWSLREMTGLKEEKIWGKLGFNFWKQIPISREFVELRSLLMGKEVRILTCLPPCNRSVCLDGKSAWRRKHYSGVKMIFCKEKWLLARNKNDLLIDDLEINVEGFEKHGGSAILVPRPWNNTTGSYLDKVRLHLGS